MPDVRALVRGELAGLADSEALVLIEGGPGSGKTVLASTICFESAARGRPCLYLTFREQWRRFARAAAGLGFDAEDLTALGLFRFVRVPILSGSSTLLSLVKVLTDYIPKLHPKVVVIDGAETALTPSKLGAVRVRSILQNFLYDLPSIAGGPVVVTCGTGLPGSERGLRELEYVADVVLLLEARYSFGRLRRVLKVVKDRGRYVGVELTPFRIGGAGGRRARRAGDVRASSLLCPVIEAVLGPVRSGECVLLAYPPDWRSVKYMLAPAAATLIANELKTALLSLSGRSEDLIKAVLGALKPLGVPEHVVSDYVIAAEDVDIVYGGPEALVKACSDAAESLRPDVVTLHGLEALEPFGGAGAGILRDVVRELRGEGVVVVGLLARTSGSVYEAFSSVSDKVVRLEYVREGRAWLPTLTAWSFGSEPTVIGLDDLTRCVDSLPNRLRLP